MNLYKALNDDYREFKLHESVAAKSEKVSAKRSARVKFKESTEVNVSNEGSSTDVNIVIDNNDATTEVPAPVVEEPVVEEVTSEVEEPEVTEDTVIEEESEDEVETTEEVETKKVPIDTSIDMDDVLDLFRKMVEENPNNDKAKEFLRKYDPEFKECDATDSIQESEDEVEAVEEVEEVSETDSAADAVSKLNEIIAIIDDEGSIDAEICKNKIQEVIDILVPPTVEVEEVEVEEPLEECEVKSFNILRMSPTGNLYMIEADRVDNSRVFIVGRNFNSETNMLDEAEVFDDKDKATSKFRNVLYSVNDSKKGE